MEKDLIDKIIAYENGEMDLENSIKLIASMVKTGIIRCLQGSYIRAANHLIEIGKIDIDGNVLC